MMGISTHLMIKHACQVKLIRPRDYLGRFSIKASLHFILTKERAPWLEIKFVRRNKDSLHYLGVGYSRVRVGSTTVKTEPFPIIESTQILPRWFSTTDLVIARPKPVPDTSGVTLLAR